jgi:hypothetical protein
MTRMSEGGICICEYNLGKETEDIVAVRQVMGLLKAVMR